MTGLVAELKGRWPILEMVEHLGLEEGRKGARILCPFHADSDPSCYLYVDQDRFACFSCNETGDQLDLAAGVMGLPLAQAIASLAAQAGLDWRERDWGDRRQRQPSPAEQLLRVASKSHLEVLRALAADYPDSRGRDAWAQLVSLVFEPYDEILRRYRNRELAPSTALELLLIWWKHATGGQPYRKDLLLLWRTLGDPRGDNDEQAASTGNGGRGAGGGPPPRVGLRGRAAPQPREERHRGRQSRAPRPRQDLDQREGR